MRVGILGGGISGISFQRFLNADSQILEKEERLGGLCRSFSKDGFLYDLGGHIIFSKDSRYVDFVRRLLSGDLNARVRCNKVFFKDRYVKYPFENDLAALDPQDRYECLIGYLKNDHPKPANFKQWMYYTFGSGIVERYLAPYNEKIWKYPLESMGIEWVERIPKPPVEDVVKSALGIQTDGYLHQLNFDYPKTGGAQALVEAIVKKDADVVTDFNVTKIVKKSDGWLVADGNLQYRYDRLVCTIPLQELIVCLEAVPQKVLQAIRALRYNSLRIVLIGIDNPSLTDKSAIYVPDPSVIAHRICYMGYFSPKSAPQGRSSLIAEISTHKAHPLYRASDSELIERTIEDMSRIGLLRPEQIVATDVQKIEYGYVVYDQAYSKNMTMITDYFESIGIDLLGRFAQFEYINTDEAVSRALKLANRYNGTQEDYR